MNTINKITVSGNTYGIVDTDTKVTSAANHYTPSANNNAELTASLSGTAGAYAKDTEYTVLTGVKAQRDAKGHVTGLTYTAQKIKDTDTNTWRPLGTGSSDACAGNDSRLSDARPASDVYTWAKASSKPSYTKSEVGLGNVTNDAQVKRTEMGAASGVATLGTDGKVPSSQLPSYVDDVLEYAKLSSFPSTGESGKIYVAQDTNKTYRWSGSTYVEISPSIVIGTTTGTAADGKVVNDHINNTSNPHGVTKAQVGLGSVVNTGDSATPVSGGTTKFTTGGAYTELAKKVDKVSGKGLSTNDYTTTEKNKLSGIASGAEVNQNAFSNVGVKVGKTTTTVAADSKTDTVTLIQGDNVTLTADTTNDTITIAATDTTYSSKAAASGGTEVSLVTTGEKYTWNSKTSNTGTVTSVVGGTGLNGGTITTSGTLSVKYGTAAGTACQGNDSRLSNSRPASDVYAWAKESTKPTYIASEVMSISTVAISANTSSTCSIIGLVNAGKAQTIIYTNSGSSDYTVTVPTNEAIITPDGAAIELTCPAGGYCEVSYLNIGGTIYARGL